MCFFWWFHYHFERLWSVHSFRSTSWPKSHIQATNWPKQTAAPPDLRRSPLTIVNLPLLGCPVGSKDQWLGSMGYKPLVHMGYSLGWNQPTDPITFDPITSRQAAMGRSCGNWKVTNRCQLEWRVTHQMTDVVFLLSMFKETIPWTNKDFAWFHQTQIVMAWDKGVFFQ